MFSSDVRSLYRVHQIQRTKWIISAGCERGVEDEFFHMPAFGKHKWHILTSNTYLTSNMPHILIPKYSVWMPKLEKRTSPECKCNIRWKSAGKMSLHWTKWSPWRLLFVWQALLKEWMFYSNSIPHLMGLSSKAAGSIKLTDTSGVTQRYELTQKQI